MGGQKRKEERTKGTKRLKKKKRTKGIAREKKNGPNSNTVHLSRCLEFMLYGEG